ncbi:MAG TPA: YfcC family protein [Jiangellaceae bacterium]
MSEQPTLEPTTPTEPPTPAAPTAAKKGRFTLPSAYTILFALIVLAALATWLVPAGTYQLDDEGSPIPGTYEEVESNPQRILVDSITAPINGLYGIEDETGNISYYNTGTLFGAIDVALFIIVIGGFLGVTMRTGAIQAGIGRLVQRLRGREKWMIPLLMTVFAIGGTTYGMAEESLAFYALVITVMIAAGYDALTGAAIVLLGCGIGTFASTINPFATGIASGFADIPISDGILGRILMLILGLTIGIFFVMRYAERVRKDPAKSLVYDMKTANEEHFRAKDQAGGVITLTGRHKAILVVFGLAFVVMMYGVIPWEDLDVPFPTLWWWFPEMTASFLLFAVIIGLIDRMREGELTSTFVTGAGELLGVALIIGIARGITVIMNNGEITDTVLHWAEVALGDVGSAAFAVVMFLLFLPLSFLIPSSSGLATVAMPIMAPLAAFVGVSASLVVTAFQSANGLMNLFIPTSAVVMGGLAIARVPYGSYLRWVWPLLALLGALSLAVLGLGAVVA